MLSEKRNVALNQTFHLFSSAVAAKQTRGIYTHYAQVFAVQFGEPGVVRHRCNNHRQIPGKDQTEVNKVTNITGNSI